MFSRSKELQQKVDASNKEDFMSKVYQGIMDADYFICPNDFPYDLYEGQPCETEHLIVWFRHKTAASAFRIALHYREQGYTIIMRPLHLNSVKEVLHLHLVRKKIT